MTRKNILLINPFDKVPGEDFRDQRHTIVFQKLQRDADVRWISSDFNHWTHKKRNPGMIPEDYRNKIVLIPTVPYHHHVSFKRYISHLLLSINSYLYIRKRKLKPDIILCVGPVELVYLVSKYAHKYKIRLILDVYDLWPDLFFKVIPPKFEGVGRMVSRPYLYMSRVSYKYASHITAVSKTYMEWAMNRAGRTDRGNCSYYYLGSNQSVGSYNLDKPRNVLRCLFAGQFGFNYDLETIVGVAKKFQEEKVNDVEFILAGDGFKRQSIMKSIRGMRNIKMVGWLGSQDLIALGSKCHIGMNSYVKDATQSVPTKLFDYMSMGLLILNSLKGETAALINEYHIGQNYAAGDISELHNILDGLRKSKEQIIKNGALSLEIFKREFRSELIYTKMIREIIL